MELAGAHEVVELGRVDPRRVHDRAGTHAASTRKPDDVAAAHALKRGHARVKGHLGTVLHGILEGGEGNLVWVADAAGANPQSAGDLG